MVALLVVLLFVVILFAAFALSRSRGSGPTSGGASGGACKSASCGQESLAATPSRHLNAEEAQQARMSFTARSKPDAVVFPTGPSFFFYNVHEYRNALGADQSQQIAALVSKAARSGAEWVGLAEAPPDDRTRSALSEYPYSLITDNGGTHLTVAWKDPLATAIVVPTTGSRNCIMLATQRRRVIVAHLEIGARPSPDDPTNATVAAANARIRADNAAVRIEQLRLLLAQEPDVLIGDFNFAPGEMEDFWMRTQGYVLASGSEPSTPFNRVDHCYVRTTARAGPSALLPVAYSDHYPLVQVL